jgi:hypothetical protein
MRNTFVLRLGPKTNLLKRHFEGCIEEVDSEMETRFHSVEELLKFLGERFQVVCASKAEIRETNTKDEGNEMERKSFGRERSASRKRRRES